MTDLLPLTPDLAEQAAKIHAAAMADGLGGDVWSADSFRALLGSEGAGGWIAKQGGVVLARAIAGEAEILTIGVHPAARRHGVARALLNVCYAVLPALGADRLLLEVAVDNAPALTLYRSEGFAAVGRRTGYYKRGPARIDALVMARNL